MRKLILTMICCSVMLPMSFAGQYDMSFKETEKEAVKALPILREAVSTLGNYKEMGFKSPEELKELKPGTPLQEFFVRLDSLKEYQKGTDPEQLVTGNNHVIYPVLVNNKVRTSILLAKNEKGWHAVSFGDPGLIRMLSETRKQVMRSTDLSPTSFFIVRIPALNLYFLGHRMDKKLMLTPVKDYPVFKFKKGNSMPAEEVFLIVTPAARKHNGLPG